jgi:hypothetical protein
MKTTISMIREYPKAILLKMVNFIVTDILSCCPVKHCLESRGPGVARFTFSFAGD